MKEIAPIVEKVRERRRLEKELGGRAGAARHPSRRRTSSAPSPSRSSTPCGRGARPSRRSSASSSCRRTRTTRRNVVLEIRAGTGGDEAALFAEELFRMYVRYAESRGWKVEVIDRSDAGGVGGIKEIQAIVEGEGAFSRLKYEGGVHRVQRVPATETAGPDPHVGGHRRRPARGRGRRRRDQRQGHPRRPLLRLGPGRPGRQHDLLGRPPDAPPDRRPSSSARTSARRSRTRRRRCAS